MMWGTSDGWEMREGGQLVTYEPSAGGVFGTHLLKHWNVGQGRKEAHTDDSEILGILGQEGILDETPGSRGKVNLREGNLES